MPGGRLTPTDVEKDHYAALGVPSSANPEELKKAYRKLARDLHPDKNPGNSAAEARFKDVGRAYEVLSDADSRSEYDEARRLFGAGGRVGPGGPGGRGGTRGGTSATTAGFDLGDLFGGGARAGGGGVGDLFGGLFGGRAGRGPQRGADVAATVTVDFTAVMTGAEVGVRLPGGAACDTCGGSGARPGTAPRACPVCDGSGLISRSQGGFAFSEPCRNCGGTGTVIDDPCPTCGGTGRRDRVQKIRVPAGVRDGAKLRVRGRGEPGLRGGPAGDLEVTVAVTPHRVFGRDGANLTLALPVTFPEAALGATVTVPTLAEPVTLKVPAGSTSGRRLRVRGKGFPKSGGGRGDLLVSIEVAVPATLSPAARSALESYAAEATDDPRAGLLARAGA